MIRSKRIPLTKISNGEQLENVVTGVDGLTREITEIWVEAADDEILRGYLGTDRIVDVHMNTKQAALLAIPVHHVLKIGEVFQVGILDEAANTNVVEIVVFYREE